MQEGVVVHKIDQGLFFFFFKDMDKLTDTCKFPCSQLKQGLAFLKE